MVCRRAFVIGLDGARGEGVREAATPNIDALIADGVVTYSAKTVLPSVSFPAWGSMFHGVGPEKHQLGAERPCPEDTAWPSFIKVAQQQKPGLLCASFSCWDMINKHIIEGSCGCRLASMPDPELAEMAVHYIRNYPPDVFFMQLDFIDHAGHAHGYRTPEYLDQITATDALVGQLADALRETDILDESVVLILSDHGGEGKLHGSDHPDCLNIFWACRGPGIAKGVELDGSVDIMDTAAVVAHALGLEPPDGWDAKVPNGVFVS